MIAARVKLATMIGYVDVVARVSGLFERRSRRGRTGALICWTGELWEELCRMSGKRAKMNGEWAVLVSGAARA